VKPFIEAQADQLNRLAAGGRFPVLARVANLPNMDLSLDRLFELGLARLLDGLAPLLGAP
jgi:hypothetical protein